MVSETSNDIEILKRVASFESKALEVLYNRYSPVLYTTIKKIVADERLAEDVLTEVFVLIWKKGKVFNPEAGSVYTWLIFLARNKAVDVIKRMNKEVVLPEYTDEYEDEFIIPHLSPEIEKLDFRMASGLKGNIDNALEKLTDAQQYVLSLAFYEGLTQKEIAQKLNIPLETVKSKLKTSLANFKSNLMGKN